MRTVGLLPLVLLLPVSCGGDDAEPRGADNTTREVKINATDTLRFEPATVSANAGEQVTFVVTNTGTTDHELIGDAEYQTSHGSSDGHDHEHGSGDGSAADVPAGKTVRVSFTMPDDAPTYACHVANHDDAGMTGTVSYD